MVVLDWLCIGGGPCGTMAVGSLLERAGRPGFETIGWVEAKSFDTMGRLGAAYGSVPANTRNDRLVAAFESLAAFEFTKNQRARAARGEATLAGAPPDETCDLQVSIDALRDATAAMRASGRLSYCRDGAAVSALASDGAEWTATIAGGTHVKARRVFVATGAAPKPVPAAVAHRLEAAGIAVLDHDDVVAPDRCGSFGSRDRIGIVGGAHSGMLAAKNLLATVDHVHVFDRKAEPRFAEEREGYIKYDGTGLKGTVADWTRSKPRGLQFHTVKDGDDLVDAILANDLNAVAFCWGFQTLTPFDVTYKGHAIDCFTKPRAHDVRTGRLAKGLHAGGIAFPEFWTDPDGYVEPRVGFVLHFKAHLGRAFDQAVDETNPN